MEFYPEPFTLGIEQAERMTSIAIHMAVGPRRAAVTEEHRDLVERFGAQGPIIPHHRGRLDVSLRTTFLTMNKIVEFHRVADKKNRRIISYQIPISFLGIKFHGKAPWIADRIRRTALATDR